MRQLVQASAVAWAIALRAEAEQLHVGGAVGAGGGEVVEHPVGDIDDVVGDELRALARRDLGMLQAALPLIDRPAGEIIGGEAREDALEVDLAVAERPVARRALEPPLVAAEIALLGGRVELR